MATNINRLTNANIYNAGNSLCGRAEEITLPGIKGTYSDHKALGMMMALELPNGLDKMSGKIKWNAVYPELITTFGSPYTTSQIQVRGNLETWDSSGRTSQSPIVVFMTVRFKDTLPPITLKQNDNPELESEYSCTYLRMEVDGIKLVEVDALANVLFVNGEDQMAIYRINLGL